MCLFKINSLECPMDNRKTVFFLCRSIAVEFDATFLGKYCSQILALRLDHIIFADSGGVELLKQMVDLSKPGSSRRGVPLRQLQVAQSIPATKSFAPGVFPPED